MTILENNRFLHVVAFDIPWPANYGGAIDIYYKLKYLYRHGYKIIFHAFQYGGRKPNSEVEKFCYETYYYPRKGFINLLSPTPFIVASRRNDKLFTRLLQDDYPILYEGIHTTYYLSHPALQGRKQYVRMHNIEHEYYKALSENEKKFDYKLYLRLESVKLKRFENILKHASGILAISSKDAQYYSSFLPRVETIPAFHPFDTVKSEIHETEPFALYHGSLDVSENSAAAIYLIEQVFASLPYKLVVAGNRPPKFLIKIAQQYPNVELLSNLTPEAFESLIAKAHVNILPTFQATGIKLKLLYALYVGNHVLVNTPMVVGTGLEELCHVADTPQDMRRKLIELFQTSFTQEELLFRKRMLELLGFDNDTKTQKMIAFMFS